MMEPIDFGAIFPNGLDIYDAFDLLWPAATYVLGIAVYAFFVFKFYRFVASRDMFELDLSKYEESRHQWVRGFLQLVMYGAKYVILFPAFAFFWFAVLTLVLTFLSRGQPFADILLIALATVSAIRVTAYYNEDLSRDLAKILPFAVLAIFLIDASFFKIGESIDVLKEADDNREGIFYYLLFLVGVEFALRLILAVVAFLVSVRKHILNERSTNGGDSAPPPEGEPSQEEATQADGDDDAPQASPEGEPSQEEATQADGDDDAPQASPEGEPSQEEATQADGDDDAPQASPEGEPSQEEATQADGDDDAPQASPEGEPSQEEATQADGDDDAPQASPEGEPSQEEATQADETDSAPPHGE